MVIGVITIELHLPSANSLKAKRKIVLSLKDRLKAKFNLSVAELDDNDLWQRCVLGMAIIANDKVYANNVLSKAADMVNSTPDAVVTGSNLEWF